MAQIGSCMNQPLLVKEIPRVKLNSMKNDVVSLFIRKSKDESCAMSLNTLFYVAEINFLVQMLKVVNSLPLVKNRLNIIRRELPSNL